jgi:hypothetical protein
MRILLARALAVTLFLAASFGAAAQGLPRFEQLELDLKIRPEQKVQYDLAVGATKRALLAVGLAAIQVKERLAQELMKPSPDLRALANVHEEVVEQTRPLFKAASEEWKKLYAILDDEQVEIAKRFLRDNLYRLLS